MDRKIFAILLLACLIPAGAFAQENKAKAGTDLNVEEALKCARCGGEVGPGRHCSARSFNFLCSAVKEELNAKIEVQKNEAAKEKTRFESLTEQVIEHAYKKDYQYVLAEKDASRDPHSWYAGEIEEIIDAAKEEAKLFLGLKKKDLSFKSFMEKVDAAYDVLRNGKYAKVFKELEKSDHELDKSSMRDMKMRVRLESAKSLKK
jgi:hypothetical protein